MGKVQISSDFGIIVKKSAINRSGIQEEKLFAMMETGNPFDESKELYSFGPHFGQETVNLFVNRLEKLGLIYGDDFIDFHDMLPQWCKVYVELN